jgi:phosphatidylglycerophosphatase A
MNDGGHLNLRELRTMRVTPWAWAVATFAGAGFLRPGPGTWGSIVATLLYSAVATWLHPAPGPLLAGTLVALLITVSAGVPAATRAARESQSEDPGFVVIDEVAGMWVALLPAAVHPKWKSIVAALVFFRIFDMWKPFPVHQLEKLPEGWGIVCDDLAAGLYAGICLLLLMHWIQ